MTAPVMPPPLAMSMRRLLALATLATAGTLAAPSAFAGAGEPGMHGDGPSHGPGPGISQRMLDKVGASADQRARIDKIMKAARDDMRARRDEDRGLHERMRDLLAQPSIDTNAIEALRRQMLAQHDVTSQRMTRAMVDVSQVLTPEQRQQLAGLMAERDARGGERRGGAHRPDDRPHGG